MINKYFQFSYFPHEVLAWCLALRVYVSVRHLTSDRFHTRYKWPPGSGKDVQASNGLSWQLSSHRLSSVPVHHHRIASSIPIGGEETKGLLRGLLNNTNSCYVY